MILQLSERDVQYLIDMRPTLSCRNRSKPLQQHSEEMFAVFGLTRQIHSRRHQERRLHEYPLRFSRSGSAISTYIQGTDRGDREEPSPDQSRVCGDTKKFS